MNDSERAAAPSPARERSGLNPNVEAETDDRPTDASPTDDTEPPDRSQPDPGGAVVDPLADSPGAGVDDTESPEAVEPNEPG